MLIVASPKCIITVLLIFPANLKNLVLIVYLAIVYLANCTSKTFDVQLAQVHAAKKIAM